MDKSDDKLILSIEIMMPLLPLLQLIFILPFLSLVVDSVFSEVFNIEVSRIAIRLNLDESPVKFDKSKENLDISYLEANQLLVVRLLTPQMHS